VTETRDPPAQVVIVGAGAAGAMFAQRMAQAGKSVVLLEAGPAWNEGDLISSQIWSRRLRWGGPAVASIGEHPIGFGFNAGWGTGGAALHHYGTWPRLHEADFRMHAIYGRGLDWPFEYSELRPWYDSVQAEVGLSGDAAAEIWRPPGAPYPMPPLRRSRQADVLARGFAALGKQVAPAPMAINSVVYRGRPACLYDGWCDAGCPISALANPLAVYLRAAEGAGARVVNRAPALRLLSRTRDQIDAVEYINANGVVRQQPGQLIVLAASVAGNPTLLLNSVDSYHPAGVGNTHGFVGRFLQTHALISVFGLFPEPTEPHIGVSGAQLICHDAYPKESTPGALGSRQWLIAPSTKPNDLAGIACGRVELYGPALDRFMRVAVKHVAQLSGMAEEIPSPENRVELSDTTNAWGVRGPRLVHKFGPDSLALWRAMLAEGLEIFRRAGANEPAWHGALGSAHLMGGTIMGESAAESVTDGYGRVHGMRNLFVAGPGLFPTSGAVNPTFTVHALVARAAHKVMTDWRDIAG